MLKPECKNMSTITWWKRTTKTNIESLAEIACCYRKESVNLLILTWLQSLTTVLGIAKKAVSPGAVWKRGPFKVLRIPGSMRYVTANTVDSIGFLTLIGAFPVMSQKKVRQSLFPHRRHTLTFRKIYLHMKVTHAHIIIAFIDLIPIYNSEFHQIWAANLRPPFIPCTLVLPKEGSTEIGLGVFQRGTVSVAGKQKKNSTHVLLRCVQFAEKDVNFRSHRFT